MKTLEELINHIREEERKEYSQFIEMGASDNFTSEEVDRQRSRWAVLNDLLEYIEED